MDSLRELQDSQDTKLRYMEKNFKETFSRDNSPGAQGSWLAKTSQQIDSLRELQDSQDTKLRYLGEEC
jgi:hypothetical protein